MAVTFMPDHPIHGQVATHDQNVAKAAVNSRAYTASQTYVHAPSHSISDVSGIPDGDKYLPGN